MWGAACDVAVLWLWLGSFCAQAYCARIKFDPPDAVELHRSKGDIGPSSAAKRRKSAAAAAGSRATPVWHPISVDGNVVDLNHEFR